MILESAAVGPFFKNGFVVGCERTRQAVFIDPGDEVDQLLSFITNQQLQVTHILLTHAHVDHVSGVAEARRVLGAPIYLHRDDLFLYQNAVRTGMMFGLTVEAPPPVDHFYDGPFAPATTPGASRAESDDRQGSGWHGSAACYGNLPPGGSRRTAKHRPDGPPAAAELRIVRSRERESMRKPLVVTFTGPDRPGIAAPRRFRGPGSPAIPLRSSR